MLYKLLEAGPDLEIFPDVLNICIYVIKGILSNVISHSFYEL